MKLKPDKVNNEEIGETKQEYTEEEHQTEIMDEKETHSEAIDWEYAASEKEQQNLELVDRLQRTMAEFDNFRKRTIKEKASIYNDGVKDTIEQLLPVVDNFERAMSSSEDKENSLYKGLEMIYRQLCELLKGMGVEPVPGVGESFDHNVHHAVAHVEDETFGESVITEELLKGYKIKDKVLRPSMVKVAN